MILPYLTKKQREIPLHLFRFRFLNSKHIQKLLNNKSPRNTNKWLKYLTKLDYIFCIEQKENSFPRKPNVYYLSKNGIKFLKTLPNIEKSYVTKLYQEDRRKEPFQQRCMLIANTFLALKQKYATSKVIFKFYTQSDLIKKGKYKENLNPSFAYVLETKTKIEHVICELFKEDMPWGAISGRINRYFEFYEVESGDTICFICPDGRTYRSVKRYTRKLMREQELEHLTIFQTTYERIREADLGEQITIE